MRMPRTITVICFFIGTSELVFDVFIFRNFNFTVTNESTRLG